MDRVVASLLGELDGTTVDNTDVFVLAATNRPDLLDAALLRPGRLDELVYMAPPRTVEARLGILKALTRKFHLAHDVDLEVVARECPNGVTGADLYGLCSAAWMGGVTRVVRGSDAGQVVAGVDTGAQAGSPRGEPHDSSGNGTSSDRDRDWVEVEMQDFVSALKGVQPSVSAVEMA